MSAHACVRVSLSSVRQMQWCGRRCRPGQFGAHDVTVCDVLSGGVAGNAEGKGLALQFDLTTKKWSEVAPMDTVYRGHSGGV